MSISVSGSLGYPNTQGLAKTQDRSECSVNISFEVVAEITISQLEECSKLFNAHYAVWDTEDQRDGKRVKLSAERIKKECIPIDFDSGIITARSDEKLVGHTLYTRFKYSDMNVIWITQLVVHADYRNSGIATTMVRKLHLGHPSIHICGLATSHPFTVKALEAGLGMHCEKEKIKTHAQAILRASNIKYLQNREICFSDEPSKCTINTQFNINHGVVDIARHRLGQEWKLGELGSGEEHLAIVFCPQSNDHEIQQFCTNGSTLLSSQL